MTNADFSNNIDIYLSKVSLGAVINLNEYDKSMFLTNAQNNVIKTYFAKLPTSVAPNFQMPSVTQIEYGNLITLHSVDLSTATISDGYADNGYVFSFSDDDFVVGGRKAVPLHILNERIVTDTGKSYTIVPIAHSEYDRILSKPYSEPLKKQAWRLFESDSKTLQRTAEIILRSDAGNPDKYIIRYIRKPQPIILTDLEDSGDNLDIDGVTVETECELSPLLHNDILQEALRLIFSSYQGNKNEKENKEEQQ